jgi:mannose/fructose/N-acetylgalactosamine-specific phosphotransferase system component IIB
MGVIFVRIDNRLVHGQVVEGWLPAMKAEEVIVISPDAPKSTLMQKMLRMSLPQNYGLKMFDAAEGAKYLQQAAPQKQFILIESIKDLEELLDNGVRVESVNIGNVPYDVGKKDFGNGVFLNEEEVSILKDISQKGVKIDVRALPSSMSPARRFA